MGSEYNIEKLTAATKNISVAQTAALNGAFFSHSGKMVLNAGQTIRKIGLKWLSLQDKN